MKKLSMEMALGATKVVCGNLATNVCDALDVTQEQWELVTGPEPWSVRSRELVRRVVSTIMFGICDVQGLPHLELPAEFAAATCATLVHPSNYYAFACWMGTFSRGEDLANYNCDARNEIVGLEKCTPRQIFALTLAILGDSRHARTVQSWSDKMDLQVAAALKTGGTYEE